jgi:hypothetical protein
MEFSKAGETAPRMKTPSVIIRIVPRESRQNEESSAESLETFYPKFEINVNLKKIISSPIFFWAHNSSTSKVCPSCFSLISDSNRG